MTHSINDTQHHSINDTLTAVHHHSIMLSVMFKLIVMLSVVMVSVIMPAVITLSVVMLSVVMLSVIMLSDSMLSVIMLSVIILNVVAPICSLGNYIKRNSFDGKISQTVCPRQTFLAQSNICVANREILTDFILVINYHAFMLRIVQTKYVCLVKRSSLLCGEKSFFYARTWTNSQDQTVRNLKLDLEL